MQLTTELLDEKKRQLDEIVKNMRRLHDLTQSDGFFLVEQEFRRAVIAEYNACLWLKAATKTQIEYIEQLFTIEPTESKL